MKEQDTPPSSSSGFSSFFSGLASTLKDVAASTTEKIKEAAAVSSAKLLETVEVDKKLFGDSPERTEDGTKKPMLPWEVRCTDRQAHGSLQDEIRDRVLALSATQTAFLTPPPASSSFVFDMESALPVALALLEEDKRLDRMRYLLVPKQIKEDNFWRNYFYAISVVVDDAKAPRLEVVEQAQPHEEERTIVRTEQQLEDTTTKLASETKMQSSPLLITLPADPSLPLTHEEMDAGEFASGEVWEDEELRHRMKTELSTLRTPQKEGLDDSPVAVPAAGLEADLVDELDRLDASDDGFYDVGKEPV
eukprot:GILK01009638.1.p1 GENE.GILK01009638.1~~GILK01009638.1.p1  ORF type:complete len:306 (-),score=64.25 GILK01009638.1:590-1507(-)